MKYGSQDEESTLYLCNLSSRYKMYKSLICIIHLVLIHYRNHKENLDNNEIGAAKNLGKQDDERTLGEFSTHSIKEDEESSK